MKKIKFLLMSLLIGAALVSCSKNPGENFGQLITPGGISTFAIANNGGNITCEEVATATGCNLKYTSGKIDYYGGTGGTTADGIITWHTDGIYVWWESTFPINVAIIVKGGPNANVYFSGCGDCKTGSGLDTQGKKILLSAPINLKNDKPYGLSNITFCYNLCGVPVVAFKGFLTDGRHFVSSGTLLFADYPLKWCGPLGYNAPSTTFNVVIAPEAPYKIIGTASISMAGAITISLTEGKLDEIFTFVGTAAELQASAVFSGSYGCPNYGSWRKTEY